MGIKHRLLCTLTLGWRKLIIIIGVGRGLEVGGRELHNNGLELKQTILSLFTEINSLAISISSSLSVN